LNLKINQLPITGQWSR